MHKAIVPKYLQEFRCDGQKCPDNCCEGTWTIFVDEPHYKRVKRVTDTEIKPIIDQYYKRNRSNPTKESFGKLLQDKQKNRCAFLTEDKLCRLQAKLGPEYLCNVCMLYPRRTNFIKGLPIERSLSLSCPLAAELVLLNEAGLEFEETTLDLHGRDFFTKRIDLDAVNAKRQDLAYFMELRAFSVQIIKTRDLELWKRLVILGMFYNKVQEYLDANEAEKIPEEIERYTRMIVQGMFNELLDQIPVESVLQMKLSKEIIEHKVFSGSNEGFSKAFWNFLQGIQFDLKDTDEENATRYQEAYQQWYQPFMQSREYMLENYLVNYAFSRMFPLTEEESPLSSYAMLIVHFAMIKMLLIGNAAFHKDAFTEAHIIEIVQKFVKAVEHNPKFVDFIYKQLKKNDFLSMAHMAILIRN